MKGPKMNDLLRLKKVVRYLLKYPYLNRIFYKQTLENVVTGKGTRRSEGQDPGLDQVW